MSEKLSSKKSLEKLFRSTEELDAPERADVKGTLPSWLYGTALRVGPGSWDIGNLSMNHYLDGYAILSKFEVSPRQITFHKRFLRSEAYKKAQKPHPVVLEFGTNIPASGIFSRVVSTILPEMSDNNSSNIFKFGEDYFAVNDACFFRRICLSTLNSDHERHDTSALFGIQGWTAHPLTDCDGVTYNIGFSIFGGLRFHVVKIPPPSSNNASHHESFQAFKKGKIICTIPSSYNGLLSFMHSFTMTEKHIIFIEQPYVLSIPSIAKGLIKGHSMKQWMRWRPDPSATNRFHIIEKATGQLLKTEILSEDPFFFLHFVNCYEYRGQIVIDLIGLDDPGILDGMLLCKLRNGIIENVSQPTYRRFVVPLCRLQDETKEGVKNLIRDDEDIYFKATAFRRGDIFYLKPGILSQPGCEMPCLNKNYCRKKHSYVYVSGTIADNSFSNSISKLDINEGKIMSWKGNEYLYPGEPLFIPCPNTTINNDQEDDGIIVSCVYDVKEGHSDFLLFLDAKTMSEIARAEFSCHLPPALHTIFVSHP